MSAFIDSPAETLARFATAQAGAVISTLPAEGTHPESAWVNIAVLDDGRFVFEANQRSRKAANLRARPEAALVLVDGAAHEFQLEAQAEILQGQQEQDARAALKAAHPDAGGDPAKVIVVALRIGWARWVDATVKPSIMEETTF